MDAREQLASLWRYLRHEDETLITQILSWIPLLGSSMRSLPIKDPADMILLVSSQREDEAYQCDAWACLLEMHPYLMQLPFTAIEMEHWQLTYPSTLGEHVHHLLVDALRMDSEPLIRLGMRVTDRCTALIEGMNRTPETWRLSFCDASTHQLETLVAAARRLPTEIAVQTAFCRVLDRIMVSQNFRRRPATADDEIKFDYIRRCDIFPTLCAAIATAQHMNGILVGLQALHPAQLGDAQLEHAVVPEGQPPSPSRPPRPSGQILYDWRVALHALAAVQHRSPSLSHAIAESMTELAVYCPEYGEEVARICESTIVASQRIPLILQVAAIDVSARNHLCVATHIFADVIVRHALLKPLPPTDEIELRVLLEVIFDDSDYVV